MRDMGRMNGQREIWITRGHLWALALSMFFIGVLAFFVGLLFGRAGESGASPDPASPALVTAELEADALDELLARVEAASVEDLQDDVLSFPGSLAESEQAPAPEPEVEHPEPPAVVEPGRSAPEPPEEPVEDTPVLRSGWAVQLASYTTVQEAEEHLQRLEVQGVEGYRLAAVVQGVTRYRVRVGGYRSVEAARAGKAELADLFGVVDAIVVKAD